MLNIEKVEMHVKKYNNIENMFKWIPIKINDIPPLSEITIQDYLISICITVNGTKFYNSQTLSCLSTPEEEKEFYELYNKWKDYEQG